MQRLGLNLVLVSTMVLGPIPMMLPAVLAVDLIADLGITTGPFSLALTANTIVAALFAPLSGRITDSIGPKLSVVLTIATAGVGMFGMAFATDVWVLMASAAFAGLGQGWCNPATNKLIAERVPDGRRGTITGLKQSGVMFGTFLSGFTLPTLAVWFGWRTAIGLYGALALVFALGIQLWLRSDAPANAESEPGAGASPRRSTCRCARAPPDGGDEPIRAGVHHEDHLVLVPHGRSRGGRRPVPSALRRGVAGLDQLLGRHGERARRHHRGGVPHLVGSPH